MEWNLFKLGLAVLLMCSWSPCCVLGQDRPTASIDLANPTSANEGDALSVCVQLDMPPTSDVTAFISTQDLPTQTAVGGEDYDVLQNFPLIFTTSDTRMCVDLQVLQDGIIESVERLDIVLTSGTELTVGVSSVEVEIIDTDRVQVEFDPSVVTVDEGSTGSVCAIIANGTIDRSVSINFNVLSNTGTASSPGEYLTLTTMRSFTPSNTRVCAPITTFSDIFNEVEDDEFFEVELSSQDSVVLPNEPGRVIIRDSDGATVALQTPTDISTPEGDNGEMTTVNLCARLTNIMGGLQRDVNLSLTTVALSAGAAQEALSCNPSMRGPNDFVALDNLLLTIPSSTATGVNVCQSVTIVGDDIVENAEVFQVEVTPDDSDDTIAGTARFTVTITSEPGDDVTDCGCLQSITNGGVELNPNTLQGSVATYSCSVGHELIGDDTRTCQSLTGTWSSAEPTCDPVDCGQPSSPGSNGQVSFTPTTFNSVATYSCDLGYELVPDNRVRICQADRTWSGMDPLCQAVNCGALTDPADGQVLHPQTTFGSDATYTCDIGYNLVGDSVRTCQADRTWSGNEPVCEIADCGDLTDPANGHVSHPQTTFGSDATYTCIAGFTVVGDSVRTCQANSTWSGNEPVCEMINCVMLNPPTNGRLDITPSTSAPGGFMATYFCNEGHDLVGDSTRECQGDGSWTGSDPTCDPVNCGQPSSPGPNGAVSASMTTFGNMANYSCDSGYELVPDNSARSCQANRTWSGMDPLCQPVNCGQPSSPEPNGQVSVSLTTFGSMANYSCDSGYDLVPDNSIRMCQANQTWSGMDPLCQVVNCGQPSSPGPNGQVSVSLTTFGSIANYSCDSGYELVPDNSARSCQANGMWSGMDPLCQPIDCGQPSSPGPNGAVSVSMTTFGNMATYSCDPEHELLPDNSERSCQANRTWSGMDPLCQAVTTSTTPSEGLSQTLSPGAIGGIVAGAVLGVLLIIAAAVIIVIIALVVRRRKIYRKYVLPYRTFIYANKNRSEENTSNNEIRQWESDHPSHAVDAVDALEKNAGGPDDITTESAT